MKKLILVTITISLICTGYSYAGVDDKSDRLFSDQAGIFSPGYINAAKQKTEAIINQSSKQKSLMENITDYVKNKLSSKVSEGALDKPAPELKKKSSAIGENAQEAAASSAETSIADATLNYNVNIGSGSNKTYDSNGRLMSEVIDGTRHVYVGFTNAGASTIQNAMNISRAGDIVLVKSGTYSGFSVANGVKVYGGYNDAGIRDIKGTPAIIKGTITASNLSTPTEINGLEIVSSSYAISVADAVSLTVKNTRIESSSHGIVSQRVASLVVTNSEINAAWYGLSAVAGQMITTRTENSVSQTITQGKLTFTNNKISGGGDAINLQRIDAFIENNNINSSRGRGISLGSLTNLLVGDNKINSRGDKISITTYYPGTISYIEPTKLAGLTKDTSLAIKDSPYSFRKSSSYYDAVGQVSLNPTLSFGDIYKTTITGDNLTNIFKTLLNNKDAIMSDATGQVGPALLAKLLEGSALAAPVGELTPRDMNLAMALANIMKNPTEDQKMILDVVTALLNEVVKQEQESASPELKKASDDLLQMVASVLIAQAIPDLFKEGDISNIKNIFSELNTQKGKIILEYQDSVKPYYEEIAKELSNNMNILQLKNILSGNMAKEQLEKLPPNELDKILEKLRQAKDKSLEEEHILQQEAKYRSLYIEPNKKMLEDNMKHMLEGFTKKLSGVLEEVKK